MSVKEGRGISMRFDARKQIFAVALSLVTVGIGSSAVVPQASAEVTSTHGSAHASTRFAPDRVINHQGSESLIGLTLDDNSVNAVSIGAITEVNFFGHMQFLGPRGFNVNSPGGERQFYAQQGGAIPIDPPRLAASGSVWCVRLLQYNGPNNYTQLDDNCVIVP